MTQIGPSTVFDGSLTSDEDLSIDGQVSGNIHVRNAAVTVGRSAQLLECSIRAAAVTIHGTVQGSISAGLRIELSPSATVLGDLSATQVVIADGAKFSGRVDMGRRTVAAKLAQYKAAAR